MKRRTGARTRSAVVACAILGLALGSAPAAVAATITVTTEQDAVAADGQCSLREAITAANADSVPFAGAGECAAGSGADTAVLTAGAFVLSLAGPPDDTNVAGDLDILGTELTIAGAGASATTIDANGIDRAIDVRVGRIAAIRDLTVIGGSALDGADGADRTGSGSNLSVTGGPGNPGEPGGGIRNLGTLTVLGSKIFGNTAGAGGIGGTAMGGNAGSFPGSGSGGSGGAGGAGGGIFNSGVLTVIRSEVSDNTSGAGGAGGYGQGGSAVTSNGLGGVGMGGAGGDGGGGGGIAADSGATTTIQDSSIIANTAGRAGDGGLAQGGNGGPAGFMSAASGGTGGQGSGVRGGTGGGGGGIKAIDTLVATGVLIEGNAAGAGGDGGNANGSVGGPAFGTGNGGNGGSGNAGVGWHGGSGGGIMVTSLTLVASTVTANVSGRGGDGGNGAGGQGGGAAGGGTGGNGGPGDAGNGGDGGSGGGLRTQGASTIRHVTITSNELGAPGTQGTAAGGAAGNPGGSPGATGSSSPGSAGSGGAASAGGATTLTNSIVAANAAPSCAGTVVDGQHDIVFPDASCPGANVDPIVGALADNGGPTKTQAIGPGSPALDAVPPAGAECSQTDQRGVIRPQGAACDVGAYEWAPPSVSTGQAIATSSTTATLQGVINPNARETSYHFELGTTTAYGRSTPAQSAGAGTAALTVEGSVDGLAPEVIYHYRVVATNSDGTAAGEDRTFVIGDSEAPRFLSASLAPRVFAVNRRGRSETPVASRTRRGTRFRYALSEPARVLFAISRAKPGRRVGRRCVRPTRRNAGRRRCTRFVLVRRFAVQARAGSNTKRFSGKIGRRSLRRGTYRATLTASDAAGNVSTPRRLRFRVVSAR